jgi:ribosome-interacting GTPase 1
MVYAPISAGELYDKITILQIKLHEIKNFDKIKHVRRELNELTALTEKFQDINLSQEIQELSEVNKKMWYNEDLARTYGNANNKKPYDMDFVHIASSTYAANERRAQIKQTINKKCNSTIVEAKSYT